MEIVFRLPGNSEYSFVEMKFHGSLPDVQRELRDVDDSFLNLVGNLEQHACTLVTMGVLQPQVMPDASPQYLMGTPDGAVAPPWASQAPQEAQGYSAPPQAYNAPQGGYQAPAQPYQQQYATQVVPGQANNPPGLAPPGPCRRHGQMAEYRPAGQNKRTQKPYNAFWACPAGDFDCTKESDFPRT